MKWEELNCISDLLPPALDSYTWGGMWLGQGQAWASAWRLQPGAHTSQAKALLGEGPPCTRTVQGGRLKQFLCGAHPCQWDPQSLRRKTWHRGKMPCASEALLWHLLASFLDSFFVFKSWKKLNTVCFLLLSLFANWFLKACRLDSLSRSTQASYFYCLHAAPSSRCLTCLTSEGTGVCESGLMFMLKPGGCQIESPMA